MNDSTFAEQSTNEPHGLMRVWRDPQVQWRISAGMCLWMIGVMTAPLLILIAAGFLSEDDLIRMLESSRRAGLAVCLICFLGVMILGGLAGFAIGWRVGRKLQQVRNWTPAKGALLGAATISIPSFELFVCFVMVGGRNSPQALMIFGSAAGALCVSGALAGANVVEQFKISGGGRPSAEERRKFWRLHWRRAVAALLLALLSAAAVVYALSLQH